MNADKMEDHCREIRFRLALAAKEDKVLLTIIDDFLTSIRNESIRIDDGYESEMLNELVKATNGQHERNKV